MIRIPVFQDVSADFQQEIELNGQLVTLRLIYNIRVGCFFLNFIDQEGNILYGIKVVPNWPLLEYHQSFIDFNGDFVVRKDSEDVEDEITYDNLGSGQNLYYYTEAEVEEWKIENGF